MVCRTARAADLTARRPLDEFFIRNGDVDDAIEFDAEIPKDGIEGYSLAGRTREAVEDKAFLQSSLERRSLTIPTVTASGTSWPLSIYFLASRPSGVCSFTAARNISPVEIWGIPYLSINRSAWVPLPAPEGPLKEYTLKLPLIIS